MEQKGGLDMENKRDTFHYTYSAKQQEEIRDIRKKYLPTEESKMEQLRRLDQMATKKGAVVSVFVGVMGFLLLGVGICCGIAWMFLPGILLVVIGIADVAAAYPVYFRIIKKERKKIAPQILKITEELSRLK